MRTTIRIDDELYRRAKAHAALGGRSVGELIEDAVRVALRPRRDAPHPEAEELPTYGGSGTLPGVDLEDVRSLRDSMDAGRSLDALH